MLDTSPSTSGSTLGVSTARTAPTVPSRGPEGAACALQVQQHQPWLSTPILLDDWSVMRAYRQPRANLSVPSPLHEEPRHRQHGPPLRAQILEW